MPLQLQRYWLVGDYAALAELGASEARLRVPLENGPIEGGKPTKGGGNK